MSIRVHDAAIVHHMVKGASAKRQKGALPANPSEHPVNIKRIVMINCGKGGGWHLPTEFVWHPMRGQVQIEELVEVDVTVMPPPQIVPGFWPDGSTCSPLYRKTN